MLSQSRNDDDCSRCFFVAAFDGKVRRGTKTREAAPATASAWKSRFVFTSKDGIVQSWLVSRPPSWGVPFGIGCYECNTAEVRNCFGTVEYAEMNCSHLSRHERSQQHKQAVEALGKVQVADLEPVPFSSGVAGGVPRLDRWLHAAQVLERSDSFAGLSNLVSIASVGSGMMHGHGAQDDSGHIMCKRLISCMAEPLRWRDLQVLGNSTCASIGIDERDGVLLLYARVYVRRAQEVYDVFLGLVRDQGTLPSDCRRGIELVIMQACTIKTGKGLEEVCNVCHDAVETFKIAVRSAVADGGPTEQRALFDCSPALSKNPLFPNLVDIHRDRAHKWRSIQKGVWKGIDTELSHFLEDLMDFVKMLQTSSKYQKVFKERSKMLPDLAGCVVFGSVVFGLLGALARRAFREVCLCLFGSVGFGLLGALA